MAQLPEIFIPTEQDKNPFEVVPAGWYEAEVIKSETKSTTNGKMISLRWKILNGEYEGRFVYENLNYINSNETAVRIARAMLRELCDITGVEELENTEDLHGIAMWIKVSIKPETAQWPEKNEVKAHLSESDYIEKFSE